MSNRKGFLLVVSSPSGGGKTTVCRMLVENRDDIVYSISATTRPKRRGEADGRDYFFISQAEFLKREKNGFFAETAVVHDYRYGTPVQMIEEETYKGKIVIMDLDVQGAKSIKKKFSDSVTVFILPPSMEVLKSRLMKRNTDDDETIKVRMKNAEAEIKEAEDFDYRVINESIDETYVEMLSIIDNEIKRRNK
ncbi:MAG: guanylate kinase [bacterium]|nr:guanylate kinase [bacterium]